MNKYNLMNEVIPPLTTAQMASGGFKVPAKIGTLFDNLFDSIDKHKYLQRFEEILKEKTEPIKRYIPDWMHVPTALRKHEEGEFGYHPLNYNKELLLDEDLGKYYENIPYNEYDAFADMLEGMIYEKAQNLPSNLPGSFVAGEDLVISPKDKEQYDFIIKTLREQLEKQKEWQGRLEASPPQYKADIQYSAGPDQIKLKKSLELIKKILGEEEMKTLNSRGGLHGYMAGGSVGKYFVREPVKAAGKFLKDNIPPVFEKFVDYLPKIGGTKTKYSAQKNPDTGLWDIGTTSGKKKIEVEGKWVKNPDYFKATETGFKDQTSANKAVKQLQKQQVGTVSKPDKAEGALVWKSRETIADAPFEMTTKKQWLDYLLSRGVGYKELSDTSLFLTKGGKHTADMVLPSKKVKIPQYEIIEEFNEKLGKIIQRRTNKITGYKDSIEEQPLFGNLKITKPGDDIRIPEGGFLSKDGDLKISKGDLLKEFDELVPKIKVHLLGNRNFSDGLKYIAESLKPRGKKKRSDYGDTLEDIEGAAKYYLDYPRADFDVKFEGLVKQVSALIARLREAGPSTGRQEEGAEAFNPEMVEGVVDQINAAFKNQYGVDNVIGKGINQREFPNLPFEVVKLGNNLADIFSKRGIQYKQRGQPQHEGDQILQGGYNHNELVFTFEPGKARIGEVGDYKPGHSFNLGKDAEGGFVHTRISDRIDEAGRKILFVEEIQSDMHQAVQNRNAKYKPRLDRESPDVEKLKELKDLNKTLKKELKNVQKNLEKAQASETKGRTPQEIEMRQNLIDDLEIKRNSMMEELEGQAKEIGELEGGMGTGGNIPEGPFKNSKDYAKFVIKYLLKMARENGYDGVGVSNAWIKTRGLRQGSKDFEGHFGFYGNWGLPNPAVPGSFKDAILKDAMGEVSRDSKTKLALTAIKDHEIGRTWGDIPVLLLTRGKNKEIIEEAAKRIDKGQSAYYKGGLVREVFQDVVPAL